MGQTKDWYASTTVWGGIIAAVAPLVGLLIHQQISSATVQALATDLADLGAGIGGIIAIIGRMRATTTISAPVKGH